MKDRLYRLALRITLNTQEAEDVVQDTMLKVWAQREEMDKIESVEAYALTLCRNVALDKTKRMERQNMSLDDMSTERMAHDADPLEQLQQNDNISRVRLIMNSLPEKQRSCMQMRDFEGMSYKEIGEVMGIPEQQVKINIFRARKAIKERFVRES